MRSGDLVAWVIGSILLAGCESPEDYVRVNRQPEIGKLEGHWTLLPPTANEALSRATGGQASAIALTLRADQSCALGPDFIGVLSDCYETSPSTSDELLCSWGPVEADGDWEVQVVASTRAEGDSVFARMGFFEHVEGHYSLSGACVSGTGYALYRHSAE